MLESMLSAGESKPPSPYQLFLEASKNLRTISYTNYPGPQEGWFQVYIGSETGSMYGTTWGEHASCDSSHLSRMLQHAFPDYATFKNQAAKGFRVAFRIWYKGSGVSKYIATNRNNFQSQGLSWANRSSYIDKLVWHDDANDRMLMSRPYYRGSPTVWDGKLDNS